MCRAGFGRGFGPVVRQTAKWMNIEGSPRSVTPEEEEEEEEEEESLLLCNKIWWGTKRKFSKVNEL
jgi:hypothetical protein